MMPRLLPRCEEAAPPPPLPPNLLLAGLRHWISWRECARRCADARHGQRRAPPCPYKTPTTAAIRKLVWLDGLRRDHRPDLLRAGR